MLPSTTEHCVPSFCDGQVAFLRDLTITERNAGWGDAPQRIWHAVDSRCLGRVSVEPTVEVLSMSDNFGRGLLEAWEHWYEGEGMSIGC